MQYARTIYGSPSNAPWYRGLGGLSSPALPPGFRRIPVSINYHGLRGIRPVRGMGASSSSDDTTKLAEAGAGTILSALSACGAGGCGVASTAAKIGGAALTGMAAGGPIGAGIAAVTAAISSLLSRKGPKQKIATTEIDKQVGPVMQQNLDAYLASSRTVSEQTQALANFDAAWQWLVEHCDIPEMGNPGKACVKDRGRDGCTWHATPGSWNTGADGKSTWTPAGANGSGSACWNWYVGMRDPIANDPSVVPDPVLDASGNVVTLSTDPATGETISTPVSASSSSLTPLLLAGGLLLGAIMLGGSK